MRRLVMVCLALSASFGDPAASLASTIWIETGDAGTEVATAQVPTGTGTLDTITGNLSFLDIDIYEIYVTGGGTFSAFAVGASPVFSLDPVLFLFDAAGVGVYSNDEIFAGFFPGAALLPSGNSLTPAVAGTYYLAISAYDNYPVSVDGRIFPFSPTGFDVFGPTDIGGASPVSGWAGFPFSAGAYTITLTGAEFPSSGTVPEPATMLLLGVGFAALSASRRHRAGRVRSSQSVP